ncbi:Wzz/FepE/Etk N-terminal domain-containing protein [Arcobacter sp. FWKO B]|uniref:Wzz/FepE/Etk N-terminal domain-containing protein n=1 Tax=Arcobacter sp. FWKO B TaxID=2593672 RepID=UPI0018A3678C|nr:Wzz/FepE/Etk N-terminal domain-containing protein [Arcobacter sp. FWKO B]QOG12098.1 hypothetical protein FWKOB_05000 [Arcobacter sp. FWKO B]
MQENRQYIQEDEIDLKELFKTIWDKRIFVSIFSILVTFGAAVYALLLTPTYEVKAVLEIGSYSQSNSNTNNINPTSNLIENTQNLIKRLEVVYINNASKDDIAIVNQITVVRNTLNLIEISVLSDTNEKAIQKLSVIVDKIKLEHKELINRYRLLISENINNLKQQKIELEKENNKFDGSLAIKYQLTSKINELELLISSHNIKETDIIGSFIVNKSPIKPKKSLIVTVAFVTGFILSIFLLFFMQFISSMRKE